MFIALMVAVCGMYHSYLHRDDDNFSTQQANESSAAQRNEAKAAPQGFPANTVKFASHTQSNQIPADHLVIVVDPASLTGEEIVLRLVSQHDGENSHNYTAQVVEQDSSEDEALEQHDLRSVESDSFVEKIDAQNGCSFVTMRSR